MTTESVRADLAVRAPDLIILEATTSTATVALAAAAWDVAPGQIAKTLSLRVGDRVLLVVASGDHRLDNRKLRDPITGEERDPDERMLRAVEEKIRISESGKHSFRQEVVRKAMGAYRRGENAPHATGFAQRQQALKVVLVQARARGIVHQHPFSFRQRL